LVYYYEGHGGAGLPPKFLIIQNPENPDDPDGGEPSRYMAASRLDPEARTPPPMDTCEESIRRFFKAFCEAIMRYEDGRSSWYTSPLPEKEYEDLIYKVYDVPKRARGQHTGFEARADPLGLREFFQKQDPAFNDAMFAAALYMRTDFTASILYYEHYLRLLRRMQPGAIGSERAAAGPAAGRRALLEMWAECVWLLLVLRVRVVLWVFVRVLLVRRRRGRVWCGLWGVCSREYF
jgi:hypothetical protein